MLQGQTGKAETKPSQEQPVFVSLSETVTTVRSTSNLHSCGIKTLMDPWQEFSPPLSFVVGFFFSAVSLLCL